MDYSAQTGREPVARLRDRARATARPSFVSLIFRSAARHLEPGTRLFRNAARHQEPGSVPK
eukprot:2221274-Heterocapsa_arctica.AAC.1